MILMLIVRWIPGIWPTSIVEVILFFDLYISFGCCPKRLYREEGRAAIKHFMESCALEGYLTQRGETACKTQKI